VNQLLKKDDNKNNEPDNSNQLILFDL
jgi:hypothetical protein